VRSKSFFWEPLSAKTSKVKVPAQRLWHLRSAPDEYYCPGRLPFGHRAADGGLDLLWH
jgi:hypothetical protein